MVILFSAMFGLLSDSFNLYGCISNWLFRDVPKYNNIYNDICKISSKKFEELHNYYYVIIINNY